MLTYKVVGWVCCVFFGADSVGAFLARQYGSAYFFLLFEPLGAFLVANAGSIRVSEGNIEQNNLFGRFRFEWSEHLLFGWPVTGRLIRL